MNDVQKKDSDEPMPKYTGTWIPKELEDIGLTATEQHILAKIDVLDAGAPNYCFASNEFLAKQMDLSESRISFYITKLKRLGLIREVEFNGRRRRLESLKHNWYLLARENSKKELCVKTRRLPTRKQEGCLRESTHHIEKKDIQEKELLPEPEKPKPPNPKQAPSGVVVSFGGLEISEPKKQFIWKKFTPDQISIAVERVLKMKNRVSDEACLLFALNHPDEWTDVKSPEVIVVENDKYLRSIKKMDNDIINHTRIVVGYNYIEFTRGDIYQKFVTYEKDFIEKVKNKLKELKGG